MPVYLLHGFGGSPSDWDDVREVIPGIPLHLDWTGIHILDELIDSLARQISPGPVHLVGYSMGGRLATLLASNLAKSGRPPASLVLISSGLGYATEEERAERRAKDRYWADLARRSRTAFWDEWYSQDLFSTLKKQPEERRERWMKHRMSISSENLCKSLELASPACHEYLLDHIKISMDQGLKLLYMAGELDKKYRNLAENLTHLGVATKIIPDAGHALPMEKPGEIASVMKSFLEIGKDIVWERTPTEG